MASKSSPKQKINHAMLAFAVIYIIVGGLLIYWNFTGTISSTIFAVGIFILIIISLVFKFANDFLRRRKN